MVELIDKRENIPEEVSYFELKFIIIFLMETFFYLGNLIFSAFDIVLSRRFSKPPIKFTVTLLEPEKSGESVHGIIVEVSQLLQLVLRAFLRYNSVYGVLPFLPYHLE